MARKEEKDRSRERKKRGSRYGQAKLKHAKKGIWSCVLAGMVLLLMLISFVSAYISNGKTAGYIGGVGMSAWVLSMVGVYLARKGFKEREKEYLTCKIGMACNMLFFVSFVAIFCWGLF